MRIFTACLGTETHTWAPLPTDSKAFEDTYLVRGGDHPDPVRAAEIVAAVGGDGITAHLREDRRHIRDDDLKRIQDATDLPLNLEMAATEEMLAIALRHQPHAACIVPEKREERTTEGGLDAAGLHNQLAPIVSRLTDAGIRVSLFIEAHPAQHIPKRFLMSASLCPDYSTVHPIIREHDLLEMVRLRRCA